MGLINQKESHDFSKLRYSTSSLSTKEAAVPESTCTSLPPLPFWMEGHWLAIYKFDGVSFPNGRDQITLTLPGAGLGTCAVLPNVGANPAPFVQRFLSSGSSFESKKGEGTRFVVEDVAYNLPRKFEGFWPAAKHFSSDSGIKSILSSLRGRVLHRRKSVSSRQARYPMPNGISGPDPKGTRTNSAPRYDHGGLVVYISIHF